MTIKFKDLKSVMIQPDFGQNNLINLKTTVMMLAIP